jgi:E3 ubiquitin-protein ligase SHPRH
MIAMNYVHKFFRKIMWRSSKIHVSSELQLPPQEECFSWLIFSSIEEYFYMKQHATCMDHAHQIIRSLRNDADRKESTSGTLPTESIISGFHINPAGSGIRIPIPLH